MSKIVRAVNSMLSNPDKISLVQNARGFYLFLYNDKYKWSIIEADDVYHLKYYPEALSMEAISSRIGAMLPVDGVAYDTESLGTKEAYDSFRELYQTVAEKLYGLDTVLDEILKDDM